jgi:hypothetical protein
LSELEGLRKNTLIDAARCLEVQDDLSRLDAPTYIVVVMQSLSDPSPSRRDAARQTRRDAIVQVAARYFLEHGYAGTTMSGITVKRDEHGED